jgi:glycosyltransferase involved in cell wall biosynthesis
VPALLGEADAGLFFLRGGPGALSCSPTKVGEYWACGLPVVANAGLGDLDQEIERRGVGVLVRGWQESDYSSAIDRLEELLADPESRDRCRRAAEDIYGLEAAMARQLALYRTVQERRSLGR